MSIHNHLVMDKFEEFKKQFAHSLDLVGDSADTFQILIKKNGFNLEEKMHAKAMTRVKKEVLVLLIINFETFKEDLRIHLPEGVEEFEKRLLNSIKRLDLELDEIDNY